MSGNLQIPGNCDLIHVAPLPRKKGFVELRGDETSAHLVEKAFDRAARAAREMKVYSDRRVEMWRASGGQIDPAFDSFHERAAKAYRSALVSLSKALRKFAEKYGEAEAAARGYDAGDLVQASHVARDRAKRNPAPIPKLALLGEAIEVETSANGKRQIIRPAGAVLLVSADAKTIVIARPEVATRMTNAPAGSAGARRMFEKWSKFKAERAIHLVISDKPLSHKLGNVEAIRYRSDKWTGRPTLYEHKFEKPATAIADSPRAPSVIRIDGEPRRVLVNERGIVG